MAQSVDRARAAGIRRLAEEPGRCGSVLVGGDTEPAALAEEPLPLRPAELGARAWQIELMAPLICEAIRNPSAAEPEVPAAEE